MKSAFQFLISLSFLMAGPAFSNVTYIHTDHLGSVIAESNQSGSITQRFHYEPFGEMIETPQDDVGYTGHKHDTDLGLIYMEARYYDQVLGRFFGNDPRGFSSENAMSFNRYSYANNSPYLFIDLDGEESYLVSRTLSFTDAANHNFVVTNAEYLGDPDATVYSWGDRGDDKLGRVDHDTEGFSAGTHQADKDAWASLSGDISSATLRKIDAEDAVVDEIAQSVVEGQEYSLVPLHSGGVNSNSAAGAVAKKADGGSTEVANGRRQPGAEAVTARRIKFEKPEPQQQSPYLR